MYDILFDKLTRSARSLQLGIGVMVVAAMTLIASACGGSDNAPTESAVTADNPSQSSTTAGDEGDEPIGPLFASIGMGTANEADEISRELEMLVQRKIKECMMGLGFEYVMHVQDNANERNGLGAHRWNRDWAEQNGFGFASTLFELGHFDGGLDEDPNERHLATLSEGSQQAWQSALWGNDGEQGPDDDESCQRQAENDVFGFFDDLEPAYMEYIGRVESDPKTVALDRDWSTCMREKGFEFGDTRDLLDAVAGNVNRVSPSIQVELSPDGTSVSIDGDAVFDAELVALAQDEEIRMALAEFDCSLGQREARRDIDFGYQQQMVDENQEALSAWNS